jgi:peptidoglycan/xylan/chitin deacetylase (PgdA/CDA1 family)
MVEWPKKNKCALTLTFDMDAELLWINFLKRRGFSKPSPRLVGQGTYDANVAMPKLLRLLDKYNLKAGFFIPGKSAELHPAIVKEVANRGHEIGHHGYTHTNHSVLEYAAEDDEFKKGLEALKKTADIVPRGFRLPAGDMSENTIGFLKKYDLFYDSSMIDNDIPYILEKGDKPIVELPMPAELDDWIYYGFNMFPPFEYQSGVKNASEFLEAITSTFDAIYKEGLYLNLVMHPQAEGKPARIAALEKFIRYVKKKPRVWITNPASIAEYWLKQEIG